MVSNLLYRVKLQQWCTKFIKLSTACSLNPCLNPKLVDFGYITHLYEILINKMKGKIPRTPTKGRGREVIWQARAHFGLKFGLEAFGIRHNGFSVFLLLFHVHIHVSHGYFVIELWHPAVRVLPWLAVMVESHRFFRRFWRRRWCWRWLRFLGLVVCTEDEMDLRRYAAMM